jgi:hypothetical protein
MNIYDPWTVEDLSTVVGDVCRALEENHLPVSVHVQQAIAMRVAELFENGITDPDRLLLEVMAETMWMSKAA